MTEEPEDKSSQPFDVRRYFDIARRRHVVFLSLLLMGWGAVWGASWLLPPRFRSSTLILVQPPSMPKNYVVPNVSDNLQDQIQSITEQIMSRTRLLLIIDKLGLYGGGDRSLTPDQKVDLMRKDIEIELVRSAHNTTITAFRIYYTAGDPQVAQEVTSNLTNLFIHENLSTRQQQSQDTTRFLESQLAIARTNLAQQDAKVRGFEAAHVGSLPSQQASNLQILSGLQSQLQNEEDALNAARQQRVYHESLVDQYRALDATTQIGTGGAPGLSAIDQRLSTLQSKLADLSTRYTDRYPGIRALKSEIAKTEKERQQLLASAEKPGHSTDQSASIQLPAATESKVNAPLLQFQSQSKADEVEIGNREHAIANLRIRIGEYQARLNNEPAVAQQLADLTRGYQQSQQNYDELLKKVSDSQMATTMEQKQQGERFTIIDPPSLPVRPEVPNRLKMCGIGLAAGLGLGVVVVGLLEFFDDRLHSDKDIKDILPAAVLSEVPEIVSAADEKRNRRRAYFGWALAGTVTLIILAAAAFSYLGA